MEKPKKYVVAAGDPVFPPTLRSAEGIPTRYSVVAFGAEAFDDVVGGVEEEAVGEGDGGDGGGIEAVGGAAAGAAEMGMEVVVVLVVMGAAKFVFDRA